jgi:hypothetical protein
MMDIDKSEVETYKSLNEKRAEKGQEALDFTKIKNPADLPMNSYAIQAWRDLQQSNSPFGDMGGMNDMGEGGDFEQDDENAAAGEEAESGADEEAWGELEDQQGEGGQTVEKSLARKQVVRIVI